MNHKRVYRVMKVHGLPLDRHIGGVERRHDGRIAVDERNRRWCSDVFEITCWSGDIVHIVFGIHAHDREVLAWHAAADTGTLERRSTSPLLSAWCHAVKGLPLYQRLAMVRDPMLEAVELRFGAVQAPHAVE